jgi:hypothetical protein
MPHASSHGQPLSRRLRVDAATKSSEQQAFPIDAGELATSPSIAPARSAAAAGPAAYRGTRGDLRRAAPMRSAALTRQRQAQRRGSGVSSGGSGVSRVQAAQKCVSHWL